MCCRRASSCERLTLKVKPSKVVRGVSLCHRRAQNILDSVSDLVQRLGLTGPESFDRDVGRMRLGLDVAGIWWGLLRRSWEGLGMFASPEAIMVRSGRECGDGNVVVIMCFRKHKPVQSYYWLYFVFCCDCNYVTFSCCKFERCSYAVAPVTMSSVRLHRTEKAVVIITPRRNSICVTVTCERSWKSVIRLINWSVSPTEFLVTSVSQVMVSHQFQLIILYFILLLFVLTWNKWNKLNISIVPWVSST